MRIYRVTTPDGAVAYIADQKDNVSPEIRAMTIAEQEAAGWTVIEDVPQPADTAQTIHDLVITTTAEGIPTITWVPRQKTNEELTREAVARQIDDLNALLGTTGVIDQTTLRGIKATANADINASPAKYIKALADILIALVQAERRASRTIARRFENTQ